VQNLIILPSAVPEISLGATKFKMGPVTLTTPFMTHFIRSAQKSRPKKEEVKDTNRQSRRWESVRLKREGGMPQAHMGLTVKRKCE